MKKAVSVCLEGGCGNQLFQFFAGLYLARNEGVSLNVDLARILANRHSGFSISESAYLKNLPGVDFFEGTKNHGFVSKTKEITGLRFVSKGVGFPENYKNMKRAQEISGYFQTYYFFQGLVNKGFIKLDLFKRSILEIFRERVDMPVPSEPSAIFHIRGGDFINLKNSVGMLSPDYFSKLSKHPIIKNRKIYLISNIPHAELANSIGSKFEFNFIDSKDWHPLGIISYISQFDCIAISNSTLSWWGGYLQSSGKVITPKPWFAGLSDPETLIPRKWEEEESIWLT